MAATDALDAERWTRPAPAAALAEAPPRPDAPRVGARAAFRADLARWLPAGTQPSRRQRAALMTMQPVWAVAEYRFSRWVRTDGPSGLAGTALRAISFAWHRTVEILTGISISSEAAIGPGLYIGHFGGIIVGPGVVMGEGCNIAQGVTIGVSGHGETLGSPTIGDEVHVMAGAKVFGKIAIGSRTRIGANAVVAKDLPGGVVATGVPATDVRPDTTRRG